MRLNKIEKSALQELGMGTRGRKGYWYQLLDEFVDMDCEFAEVEDWQQHWCNVHSAVNTLRQSVKRFGYDIRVFTKNKRVFLGRGKG